MLPMPGSPPPRHLAPQQVDTVKPHVTRLRAARLRQAVAGGDGELEMSRSDLLAARDALVGMLNSDDRFESRGNHPGDHDQESSASSALRGPSAAKWVY